MVEIRDVILPEMLKRAMAKEAEATREKLARIIKASAEQEAAKSFSEFVNFSAIRYSAQPMKSVNVFFFLSSLIG